MEYGYLAHHGVKGMRWGVRNYQNADGTLTAAGKERYQIGKNVGKVRGTDKIYSVSKVSGAIRNYKRGSVASGLIYTRERNRVAAEMRKDLTKAYKSGELSKKDFDRRMSNSQQAANNIVRGQLGNKSARAVGKAAVATTGAMIAASLVTAFSTYKVADLAIRGKI